MHDSLDESAHQRRDWLKPLICLSLTHTLVDTCALSIAPLWKQIDDLFAFSQMGLMLLMVVQSMPTSISQVVFGYIRDRRPTPQWLWIGPLVAVLLTTIGLFHNPAVLFALLIIGGIGVGAFHPEAAVTAARLVPGQRARGISVFMFGGSLGLALGPVLSGLVTDQWGLPGLAVLAVPVLICVMTLRRIGGLQHIHGAKSSEPDQSAVPTLREMMAGRGHFAIFLLLICSLRLVPNMAMDKILNFTLSSEAWGFTGTQIGLTQATFLVSASVGMALMATLFRAGWEKRFMVVCPLLAIPFLMLMGWDGCPKWLFIGSLIPMGATLWGTSPAMVSYAQHYFPKGAGTASALTMGLSWGIGGLIQAPITSYFSKTGHAPLAFWAFVPCLLLSAIGASMMPGEIPANESAQ
ncbi:MAG: MFS transporter [Planctomycetota bacterium]|nr:MFS transporter [Planctomycetota bacterium]